MTEKKIDEVLLPTIKAKRTWGTRHFFSLWIGMTIGIPTYYLASGLLAGGMNLVQAMFTILVANLILLIPLYLNGDAGNKYGIPSTVYWRSAFGYSGNTIPTLFRAIIGGGWFGIQMWVGGSALQVVFSKLIPGWESASFTPWISFFIYWCLNMYFLISGANWIKKLESFAAPFLLLWLIVLLIWARTTAGGWGPLAVRPSTFTSLGAFLAFLIPSLNANIGYWAAMPLNITEFTRYSKDNSSWWKGQAFGLPLGMFALALVGSLVTSCSVVIFGEAIWDPIEITSHMNQPVLIIGMMGFLMLATLTTNVAANGYSPTLDLTHISNGRLTFRQAGLLLGIIGVLIQPWKLMSDFSIYMNLFLSGSAVFMAPIAGILIFHYYFVCRRKLTVSELYDPKSRYTYSELASFGKIIKYFHYLCAAIYFLLVFVGPKDWVNTMTKLGTTVRLLLIALAAYFFGLGIFMHIKRKGGINPLAIFSLSLTVIISYLGVFFENLIVLYDASYFIGLCLAGSLYYVLMRKFGYIKSNDITDAKNDSIEKETING